LDLPCLPRHRSDSAGRLKLLGAAMKDYQFGDPPSPLEMFLSGALCFILLVLVAVTVGIVVSEIVEFVR